MKAKPSSVVDTRIIYCGDNLEQLAKLPDKCIDLIYIDPPFNSNRNYEVFWPETGEKRRFEDRHASTQAYIDFMRPRCVELHRVLSDTGSFYYHCDWHASHYVKVMLDQIFGENQFQNEIVWKRTSAHASAKKYGPVHDIIFFYTAGRKYVWNPQYQAYDPAYLEMFFEQEDPDGRRWKRMDLTGDGVRNGESGMTWRGVDVTAKGRHWAIPGEATDRLKLDGKTLIERLDAIDSAGMIHWPKKSEGVPRFKQYADTMLGVPLQTVWNDIRPLHNLSVERLGYPTQKPLPLLERIIKASSNPGDIILDAFCGCGTALEAAERLGRQWIGIDVSPTACNVMGTRLRNQCGLKESEAMRKAGRGFVIHDLPWSEEKLRKVPHFEFENWAVLKLNGVPNKSKVGDMGIDGRIYPVTNMPAGPTSPELGFMDIWYPIQVKQKEKAGRIDIDNFETAMRRANRTKGYFVAFDFTEDAIREIRAYQQREGRVIKPLRITDMLDDHQLAFQLA